MRAVVWTGDVLSWEEERTDQELISTANAGEASAFECLYFRYRDWVVNLAFRFCADRELALDILQETFLYLLKKFPGFTLTCQMKSFLYPVVKHLALNALAKAKRFEPGDELFESLEAPGTAPSEHEALRIAIGKLPPQQRETVILRFMEGFDLVEIAAALEVPVGTVKSRLHHALEALRTNPALRGYFD
jgi:RNA polymerase sigma-70 factor (ECF subfamily)